MREAPLRRAKRGRPPTWAALILLCVCFSPVLLSAGGERTGPPDDRPASERIQTVVGEILSDPRFAPRRSFWQWLGEKLSAWEFPDLARRSGWLSVLVWILGIWCVLALVAILVHLIWTLVQFMPRRSAGSRTRNGRLRPKSVKPPSYEELRSRMVGLAERGAFREAVREMMVGLVRWLDDAGVLRFHRSKTNGDYVREYHGQRGGHEQFRRFALAFDALIYGGSSCGCTDYGKMLSAFEQIQHHVR